MLVEVSWHRCLHSVDCWFCWLLIQFLSAAARHPFSLFLVASSPLSRAGTDS
jgi:hypothetical protein